jgi:ribosomal protein L19
VGEESGISGFADGVSNTVVVDTSGQRQGVHPAMLSINSPAIQTVSVLRRQVVRMFWVVAALKVDGIAESLL